MNIFARLGYVFHKHIRRHFIAGMKRAEQEILYSRKK